MVKNSPYTVVVVVVAVVAADKAVDKYSDKDWTDRSKFGSLALFDQFSGHLHYWIVPSFYDRLCPIGILS